MDHRLDREEARRIAVRAQLLDARRPADLLATVRGLTLLQLDPTAAVARARTWWRGAASGRRTGRSTCSRPSARTGRSSS